MPHSPRSSVTTIGRPDIDLREHGAAINARMGLNTWAALAGNDQDAMVAGDMAMPCCAAGDCAAGTKVAFGKLC